MNHIPTLLQPSPALPPMLLWVFSLTVLEDLGGGGGAAVVVEIRKQAVKFCLCSWNPAGSHPVSLLDHLGGGCLFCHR